MEKLPKAFKKKWVDALMSGDYKQGFFGLWDHIDNSYCCLGVSCAMSGISNESLSPRGLITEEIDPSGRIPRILVITSGNNVAHSLASMNDNEIPFEVIAGFIHENL